MKNSLISYFLIIVLVYLGFGLFLFVFQRNLLYFPTPKIDHGFSEIVFENEKETLRVVVLNQGNEQAIIYFGGNAEAVAVNAQEFAKLYPDRSIYLVNYRGYGGSTGSPSEAGIYSDALTVFDQLSLQHSDIAIIGRSLGSGVATYIAVNRNIDKLVLITPFDSVQNVAQRQFLIYPAFLLLLDKYDSLHRAHQIKSETLILIAERDEVIDIKHTENLINAFPAALLTVETIKKTGHNSISTDTRYYNLLRDFI